MAVSRPSAASEDIVVLGRGSPDRLLSGDDVRSLVGEGCARLALENRRVLLIIPDGTRTAPVGRVFRHVHGALHGRVKTLDVLIALGTHQPMPRDSILKRLDVTETEMAGRFAGVRVFNHHWERPGTFKTLGILSAGEVGRISGGLLARDVPVTINRLVFDYDVVLICGPVFPHEVAGFSGGNKYFFPGISGSEVIDFTHWLGALITCTAIIGTKHTPVREVIDRAAAMIGVEKLCLSMVVRDGGLAGLYFGTPEESWSQAVDLSARVHIRTMERPFRQVVSVMPRMYEDIWTAAKGMYKLEPVVEDGGEVILYAPHITELSVTHGAVLERIGYHVRDYFTAQWDRFRQEPWGVLAHSTHLRGLGSFENGIEKPRIRVTLATGIPRERCEAVHLGYRDPASIRPEALAGREEEGILLVPRAGEILHRLQDREPPHGDHRT